MQTYPNISRESEAFEALLFIIRARLQDVKDWGNLPDKFMSGRRVGRVPSASNNVITGDVVNDFNITATYAYFLINNAGTAEWRRVAVSSW